MSESKETRPGGGYERATHTFESDRSQKASTAGVASIPVVTSNTPPPLPAPSSGAKAASDS
jgi:hypothetical protein